MFNRTTNIKHESPSTIVHHEYRAPTDDSVRLYGEFVDKARASVHAVYHHGENNVVKWSAVHDEWARELCVYVTINGQQRCMRFKDNAVSRFSREDEIVAAVREAVAAEIVSLVLVDVVKVV